MSKPLQLEIDMENLGQLPLYPPRRTLVDLTPTWLVSYTRRNYRWPAASKREVWAVSGLMLRAHYTTSKVEKLIEEMPAAYFQSEEGPKEPGTISGLDPNDPYRWS